jgi:chromate transporter
MTQEQGSPAEVLRVFFRLGLTSFGGPVAHLGYFRDELVARRRWIDEAGYAELVALCQFLPGPASSQVGFALGLRRAGWLGGLAVWTGFTLPSAILLLLFAQSLSVLDHPMAQGAIHGLKLVAVAVVAHAVWGMARSLAPDRIRASIAALGAVSALLLGGAIGQVAAIIAGAVLGIWLCRSIDGLAPSAEPAPVNRRTGGVLLLVFAVLLFGLPLLSAAVAQPALTLFDAFYRSGALVFGGGHVVLPLLEAETMATAWVTPDAFLAGYGAAQAVPGPLFTFAAFLGAAAGNGMPGGWLGAAIALVAIFLPGLLRVAGALPFWHGLRDRPLAQAAVRGVNAIVVGLLGAALYDPVFVSAIGGPLDFALALVGFVLLAHWRTPAWAVVLLLAATGALLAVM